MSETRDGIAERFGPVETVSEAGRHEVVRDGDGDHWIGRRLKTEDAEYTLVDEEDGELSDFFEAIADAGLLPEEYQPDDPTRSPEAVAETWYRAEDRGGHVMYYPVGNGTDVSHSSMDTPQFDGPLAVYGEGWDCFRYELGQRRDPTRSPWKAHESVETVDAADVPFTEVPADD